MLPVPQIKSNEILHKIVMSEIKNIKDFVTKVESLINEKVISVDLLSSMNDDSVIVYDSNLE